MISLSISDPGEALDRMCSALRTLGSKSLQVGLVGAGGSAADHAALLEHGSPAQGVPGRPFFDAATGSAYVLDPVTEGFTAALEAAVSGDEAGVTAALEAAGAAAADGIRAWFDAELGPPNAPITVSGGWMRNRISGKPFYISGKGFNRPGYDSGALYNAFTYELK